MQSRLLLACVGPGKWGGRRAGSVIPAGASKPLSRPRMGPAGEGLNRPAELITFGSLCDQSISGRAEMSGKIVRLQRTKKYRNATSRSNGVYRVGEHLTLAEMDRLLAL
jgi:hypothetical protein